MTIKMALSSIILLGLIITTCVSAWMSAMQSSTAQSASMRDDSCDDDWTRVGGAYKSNCFSRRRE
jgi:hypothetical protein